MDAIECAIKGDEVELGAEALPELAALRDCPQTPAFHAEGDVAVHSRWVYELAAEHAQSYDSDEAVACAWRACCTTSENPLPPEKLVRAAGLPMGTIWRARGWSRRCSRRIRRF